LSVLEWWDGVELWLVQLPYPFAVTLVLAVLLPTCWGFARLIDRGIDEGAAKLSRERDAEPPVREGRGERDSLPSGRGAGPR
jgi:hypothetical protein